MRANFFDGLFEIGYVSIGVYLFDGKFIPVDLHIVSEGFERYAFWLFAAVELLDLPIDCSVGNPMGILLVDKYA